ncbi:MAG TPA: sulfatase-like hydrolase/transferase, partial [Vicinamibacteria bacterium]|nr:sulfatase-like hydrolase/transferase [Vicinamibacteria bacterium]
LWLHYVNPHAPYTPPPPFDTAFLDAAAESGPRLPVVKELHGGIPRQWAVPGRDRLGYYVAQYDGEIATVDAEIGKLVDALDASPVRDDTLLVVTSDHGESLGEHGYFFDHGEDLFDPCLRIPLLIAGPGVKAGARSSVLASTLDLVPTVLDAVKVSYPPELAGLSLLPASRGEDRPQRPRLPGQNDRNLLGVWDQRFKLVATPQGDSARYTLYDRQRDPGETRDASGSEPDRLRRECTELELFRDRVDAQMAKTLRLLQGLPEPQKLDAASCERLKSLGYALPSGCS